MKTCNTCGLSLRAEAFYGHPKTADGLLGKCKECHKAAMIKNREGKAEYYRGYDRGRANLPHRVLSRVEYANSDRGQEAQRRGRKEWISRNPEKRQAHIIVGNAVRDGRLHKQPCEICGDAKADAHHDDYSKPLDVRWLCRPCHSDLHKIERIFARFDVTEEV